MTEHKMKGTLRPNKNLSLPNTPIESTDEINPYFKFTDKEEGVKDDTNKARMDLIPPELMFAVGDILAFGADKYSARNWEKGMDWGRVYGALNRHIWAWWNGENRDRETGKSHLHHAACCIAFLIAYEERGVGTDSRPSVPTQTVPVSEYAESI